MGVWIETGTIIVKSSDQLSHPAWVCGLKHRVYHNKRNVAKSHPAWVCGLKPAIGLSGAVSMGSHPAWVCGLKQITYYLFNMSVKVTPCVGVWIETVEVRKNVIAGLSHTLRGCVD